MPEIIIRKEARLDVEEQAAFLTEDSIEVAARFLDEFDRAVKRLLHFPHLGRAWPTRNINLRGLRRLTMTSFPLSIFYRPAEDALEILRVLHHSRHLPPDLQDL